MRKIELSATIVGVASWAEFSGPVTGVDQRTLPEGPSTATNCPEPGGCFW